MLFPKLKTLTTRPPQTRRQVQPPLQRRAGRSSADTPARPPGCGWFDSSHELATGLQVLEHACADALAPDLPLGDWLALHLSGWRGAAADAPTVG
jgi:hypothetical protein